MSAVEVRLSIAEAHLAALGDPRDDEAPELTAKREYYRGVVAECHDIISEAQRASLPYKDD